MGTNQPGEKIDTVYLTDFKDTRFTGVFVERYDGYEGLFTMPYCRRLYYKIWISWKNGALHYADRSIRFDRPVLVFSNPLVPYAFEIDDAKLGGYVCIFTEEFLKSSDRTESLQQSPLYKIGGNQVFLLDDESLAFFSDIFEKMLAEDKRDYKYKEEVQRNYLLVMIHRAMSMEPPVAGEYKPTNAKARIVELFLDLLERQFPILSPAQEFPLRKPADYAAHMSVHVNHLNQALQELTGKSTTAHISDRIMIEARALLKHTDWSIAEIAYTLGFASATYFNNFFKKNNGVTPLSLRKGPL